MSLLSKIVGIKGLSSIESEQMDTEILNKSKKVYNEANKLRISVYQTTNSLQYKPFSQQYQRFETVILLMESQRGGKVKKSKGGAGFPRNKIVPQGPLKPLHIQYPTDNNESLIVTGQSILTFLTKRMRTLDAPDKVKEEALHLLASMLEVEEDETSLSGGRKSSKSSKILSKKYKQEIITFLNAKKRQELHDYCKLKGIKLTSDAKKEDYINAIIANHKKTKHQRSKSSSKSSISKS
jgi:hypothetical protein